METDGIQATAADVQHTVVSFRLHDRTYALPLSAVVQIIPMVKVTTLPQGDPALAGVLNFHGTAVAVVNLRLHLGMPPKPPGLHTPILLVHVNDRVVGLIVDEVVDVVNLRPEEVVRISNVMPDGLHDIPMLYGLTNTPEGAMLLLDVPHLFSSSNLAAFHEAIAQLPAEDIAEDKVLAGDAAG